MADVQTKTNPEIIRGVDVSKTSSGQRSLRECSLDISVGISVGICILKTLR